MIFETHAHYEDKQFAADREALLAQFPKAGIACVVNVGSSMKTSMESVELAGQYDFIYAAVGLHPDHAKEATPEHLEQLAAMCRQKKTVAIGEIGLDYHYEEPGREIQKKAFIQQLELAYACQMPVIIHSRDAAEDTWELLNQHHGADLTGVIHCFGYSREMAERFIDMGYYIGVGGVVTFKNARKLVEVVEAVDLSHIVLETDCPYMAPVPHRGKRNSSLYLPFVAEKIAEIKKVSVEEVYEKTMQNARQLYRITE